jgi:hypothetical protein
VARGLELARPANRPLARRWDGFVTALVEIARGRTAGWDDLFAHRLGTVLREETGRLVRRLGVSGWRERELRRFLDGLRFVAETYEVVVSSDRLEAVLHDVTVTFERWAERDDFANPRRGDDP